MEAAASSFPLVTNDGLEGSTWEKRVTPVILSTIKLMFLKRMMA